MSGKKTTCVKIAAHEWVAPVDWNRVDKHRIENLFRRVAGVRLILESDREFSGGEKGPFVSNAMADGVEHFPAGVDRLVARELAKEIVARAAERIGHNKCTKPCLLRQHGIEVGGLRQHQRCWIAVQSPQWQPKVTRVGRVLKREGPIAGVPVGGYVFAAVEDAHAVVLEVFFATTTHAGVDNEVG